MAVSADCLVVCGLQLRVFEAHQGKFQTLMTQNQSPVAGIKPTDTVIV